eukprot:1030180-Rhodomonas_salina.1
MKPKPTLDKFLKEARSEDIRINGHLGDGARANQVKTTMWCNYCEKDTDHARERCQQKNCNLKIMREAGKLRELQAQLKKACMLDDKGHFKKPGDKRQTSDADCPCGRCQSYNRDVKDCFDRPENASKRPEGYKTRKQREKERARRGAAEEEDDDEDDERPAIVSVARTWSSVVSGGPPPLDDSDSYEESDRPPPLKDSDSDD